MKLKLWKARVVEVYRYATLELENGTSFQLPATYAAEDGMYHLDQNDEVFIHVDEEKNVLLVIPFEEGGLSISLKSDGGDEFLIEEVKAISKEEFDDL